MLVFTSCTNNYIPKARILASSIKRFHPDWEFCLLLGEGEPEGFDLKNEPFDRILYFSDVKIPNFHSWLFRHRVVEICTAAKAPALKYFLCDEKQEKVIYLDPDTCVFDSLEKLSSLLDKYDVLLTPHQLEPEKKENASTEICSLQHGIYNLGFIAVNNSFNAKQFASWWSDRLYEYCYDDIPRGLFTDQRWIDLVPALFPNVYILRDPAYNVATWNLYERPMTQNDDGNFYVRGKRLIFYHFTGYDSGAGARVASSYFDEMPALKTLWGQYQIALKANGQEVYKKFKWTYLYFNDGTLITDEMRFLYRKRHDLINAFPNPFIASTYLEWYRANVERQVPLAVSVNPSKNEQNNTKEPSLLWRIVRKYRREGFGGCIKAIIRRL